MIGPIFYQELLLNGRRNRLHVLRWIFAAWLVCQVFYFYLEYQDELTNRRVVRFRQPDLADHNTMSAPQVVGGRFAQSFVWQEMFLLVLATPALVAGAVTDEKRRGTLLYLLSAGVDSRELLLGKLLGRMCQVSAVALTGLPLFALLGGFAGVDPLTLLILALQYLFALFGLASAALLASVLCRQTRDAVLGLYFAGILGWLAVTFGGGALRYFNPFFVVAPAWEASSQLDTTAIASRLFGSLVCWGGLGGICLALACWQVRPAFRRELESQAPNRSWYIADRVPIPDDPVGWRERYVEGLSPLRSLRSIPVWLAAALIALVTTLSSLTILIKSLAPEVTFTELGKAMVRLDMVRLASFMPDAEIGFVIQSILALLIASLIVGIRCSGSVTGERERQTWEALLLTPISAKQMVRGKLWGVIKASLWYLLAYAAPAIALSAMGGLKSLLWTIVWLAVTLLAMYYVGAAGIWCSVRCKNSWRSLLGTLGLGYVGGLAIYAVCSPVIGILALLLLFLAMLVDMLLETQIAGVALVGMANYWSFFFFATCVGLALIFLLAARIFLNWAQRYIADRERTRHWYDEPIFRRSRRVPVSLEKP